MQLRCWPVLSMLTIVVKVILPWRWCKNPKAKRQMGCFNGTNFNRLKARVVWKAQHSDSNPVTGAVVASYSTRKREESIQERQMSPSWLAECKYVKKRSRCTIQSSPNVFALCIVGSQTAQKFVSVMVPCEKAGAG